MGLWTRKSIQELQQSSEEGVQLVRHLGAMDLILLGIGCIIGAGLFSITGIAAAENAGPGHHHLIHHSLDRLRLCRTLL